MIRTIAFDADDTLWENNVYYEEAFDEFVAFLAHEHLSTTQIRDVLDRFEGAQKMMRQMAKGGGIPGMPGMPAGMPGPCGTGRGAASGPPPPGWRRGAAGMRPSACSTAWPRPAGADPRLRRAARSAAGAAAAAVLRSLG